MLKLFEKARRESEQEAAEVWLSLQRSATSGLKWLVGRGKRCRRKSREETVWRKTESLLFSHVHLRFTYFRNRIKRLKLLRKRERRKRRREKKKTRKGRRMRAGTWTIMKDNGTYLIPFRSQWRQRLKVCQIQTGISKCIILFFRNAVIRITQLKNYVRLNQLNGELLEIQTKIKMYSSWCIIWLRLILCLACQDDKIEAGGHKQSVHPAGILCVPEENSVLKKIIWQKKRLFNLVQEMISNAMGSVSQAWLDARIDEVQHQNANWGKRITFLIKHHSAN